MQCRLDGLATLGLGGSGAARTIERLLLGVHGEHAEPDGPPGVELHAGEAIGDGVADVVEVRRTAAHDHAEADGRVESGRGAARASRQCGLRGEGQLERPRHAKQLEACARRDGCAFGLRDHGIQDFVVPVARDDGEGETARVDGQIWSSGSAHGVLLWLG